MRKFKFAVGDRVVIVKRCDPKVLSCAESREECHKGESGKIKKRCASEEKGNRYVVEFKKYHCILHEEQLKKSESMEDLIGSTVDMLNKII